MNTKPLISIILPVYNAMAFLSETIQSIQVQTYSNFEVISVDDLSIDGTYEFMQNIASQDPRFKIYKRESKGGTAAKALEYSFPLCSGDFVFFMSHDDLIDIDFLYKCLNKALETKADIVIPNVFLYQTDKNIKKIGKYPKNQNYSEEISNKHAFYLSLSWKINGNPFQRMELVKRSIFKADYYNSCELFIRKNYLEAQRIVFCNTNFYYRQHSGAITKQINYFTIDTLTTDLLLYQLLVDNNYSRREKKKRLWEICSVYRSYKERYSNTTFNGNESEYISCSFFNAKKRIIQYSLSDMLIFCLFRISLIKIEEVLFHFAIIFKKILINFIDHFCKHTLLFVKQAHMKERQ